MNTEHHVTVRQWKDPSTYQAQCACGWVAEWAHTNRRQAEDDGVLHLDGAVPMTAKVYGGDFWNPGL